MEEYISLDKLRLGQYGEVVHLNATKDMNNRLMDMGLIIGTTVRCVGVSLMGDPKAYLIRGAVIAIRDRDSKDITIRTKKEVKLDV